MRNADKRLKTARTKAGLTQLEVSRLLGVSEQKISRWECRRDAIPPEVARRFLSLLEREQLPA